MESNIGKTIDKIFSITSGIKEDVDRIKTDVALIKQRDGQVEKKLSTHEGKIAAIEEAVIAYKLERAKILGAAIASGSIIGGLVSFLFWIFGIKH